MSTAHTLYKKFLERKTTLLFSLALLLLILVILAVCVGPTFIHPQAIFENQLAQAIIFNIRLPRVLMAVLAGISLSVSGVLMQGLLRNPLASPYILGVAAGASFGAALVMVAGERFLRFAWIEWLLPFNAFIFALLTMATVYGIAEVKGVTTETLILGGIAIGTLFNAGVSFLMYISGENLRGLVYWIMGGLWTSSWKQVLIVSPVMLAGLFTALTLSWDLNALAMGEEKAATLGVNVKRVKLILLVLSTVLTAVVVSFTGIIGFVGLVSPHIARIIIGPDHRFLIPASCFVGAILLLLADTMSRTIINPTEIPVGIVTSMIGVPFFLYLIMKRRKTLWL